MFYQQSDFTFSNTAKSLILEHCHDKFTTNFVHFLDVTNSCNLQKICNNGIVKQELDAFLVKYDLNTDVCSISALISNNVDRYNDPHIDFMWQNNKFVVVKSRLNIMIFGNASDEMVWWPEWTDQNPNLTMGEYADAEGNVFTMPGIPGGTAEERWALLGTPKARTTDLYQNGSSAFVKTDCAHAVNVSPGPRLLITVGFDRYLEEILN